MKRIVSDKAPAALGPYVQAVDTGSTAASWVLTPPPALWLRA